MAAFDTHRTPASPALSAGRFGASITALVASIADWHASRKTRRALDALTDRELYDIGLNRADIDVIANSGQRR